MQYREGTVTVRNGDNAVIGVGVDFTGIPAGALFAVPNQAGTYEVQQVVGPTEIHLVTPWTGPNLTDTQYWIVADFTPTHGLPLVSFNDVDAARIISTALTKIDGLLGGNTGDGGQLTYWAHDYRVNTPPTPANGTAYIVGPEPTGAWEGKAGRYAIYQNGAWVFGNAKSGQLCYIAATQEYVMFMGGSWMKAATQTPKWDDVKDKPSQYAPSSHTHPASQITGVLGLPQIPQIPASKITGVLDPSQIPVLPSDGSGGSINAVVSSGGLANLTTEQQAAIRMGTIVTTTDGFRWLYSGAGSKTASSSYVQLADVTPEWNVIANKPSIFPTDTANVAGLSAYVDAKVSSHVPDLSGYAPKDSPTFNGYVTATDFVLAGNSSPNYVRFFEGEQEDWRFGTGVGRNLNVLHLDETGAQTSIVSFEHVTKSVEFRVPTNYTNSLTVNGNEVWTTATLNPSVYALAANYHAGLAGYSSVADTDALTHHFAHTHTISTTNGRPTNQWHQVLTMHRNADNGVQLALNVQGDDVRYRRRNNGSWAAWRTMWHDGNFNPSDYATLSTPTFKNGGASYPDEGGEIRLQKAPNSSAISGDAVVMDLWRNNVRFFDISGGSNVYIDLEEMVGKPNAKVYHTQNLDLSNYLTDATASATYAKRSSAQTFADTQTINVNTAAKRSLVITNTSNVSNGDYAANAEVVIDSFQPRILFSDRSTNARSGVLHWNGSSSGGDFRIMMDTAGDGLVSTEVLKLQHTGALTLLGKQVLTVDTGVQSSTTGLGATGNPAAVGGTKNAQWWSDQVLGYHGMLNIGTASGQPMNGYGYFQKWGKRNSSGGWGGFWASYNAANLYYGYAGTSADLPTWHRIWTSGNFNPDDKIGNGCNIWHTSGEGKQRLYFSLNGRSYLGSPDGFEFRNASDAHIFSVANNGTLSLQGDVWHMGGGYGVLYARSADKYTFLRGENIIFRNNSGNATLGEFKADGKFYANGDIYQGAGTWFRVRGSGVGIHWESFSGGWFMNDTSWMRVYNNKGILTTGAVSMGSFTVTSDRRIKSDLKPIQNHGEIIDATNVYEFTKDKGTANENRQYGVIAQEAAKVVPLLVKPSGAKHTDGSDLLGVDLTGYIPIMLEELKALRARVAELEKVAA